MVTTCSPRPMRAVQRAMLWAITCTASQAALAAKRPEGRWFSPTPCLNLFCRGATLRHSVRRLLPAFRRYDSLRTRPRSRVATDLHGPRHRTLRRKSWVRPLVSHLERGGAPLSAAGLDAPYSQPHYGLYKEDAGYVLDSFPIVRRQDEAKSSSYRTHDLPLAFMSALAVGDIKTAVAAQETNDPRLSLATPLALDY